MIASVQGRVATVGLDHAVVVVGGLGLFVRTTPATAAALRPGEETHLATSMVIREDAWTLYGFPDADEKEIFEVAQSVSGVGPRLALAMLSVFTPDRLSTAIAAGDVSALVKVPGVGKKSAERIVLELKDKMAALTRGRSGQSDDATAPTPEDGAPTWRTPVVEALTGLGWTTRQAEGGADAVAQEVGDDAPVAAALKSVLRELGR